MYSFVQKTFFLLLSFLLCVYPAEFATGTKIRIYRMKNFAKCANETLEKSSLEISAIALDADIFLLNGVLTIFEKVTGPLDFHLELVRCDSSQKKCERYPAMNIPQMCQRLKDKNAFYAKTLESFSPQFVCPMNPGNFTILDASVELEYLSKFRLDGYLWKCRMMLVSVKEKTTIACVDIEVAIMRGSNKNK